MVSRLHSLAVVMWTSRMSCDIASLGAGSLCIQVPTLRSSSHHEGLKVETRATTRHIWTREAIITGLKTIKLDSERYVYTLNLASDCRSPVTILIFIPGHICGVDSDEHEDLPRPCCWINPALCDSMRMGSWALSRKSLHSAAVRRLSARIRKMAKVSRG